MPKSSLKSKYRANNGNNGNNGNTTRKAKKGVRFPATMIPVTDVGETHLKTSLKKLTQINPKTGKEEDVVVVNPKTGKKEYVFVYDPNSNTYNRTSIRSSARDQGAENMKNVRNFYKRIDMNKGKRGMSKTHATEAFKRGTKHHHNELSTGELAKAVHALNKNREYMDKEVKNIIQEYYPLLYRSPKTRRTRKRNPYANNNNE